MQRSFETVLRAKLCKHHFQFRGNCIMYLAPHRMNQLMHSSSSRNPATADILITWYSSRFPRTFFVLKLVAWARMLFARGRKWLYEMWAWSWPPWLRPFDAAARWRGADQTLATLMSRDRSVFVGFRWPHEKWHRTSCGLDAPEPQVYEIVSFAWRQYDQPPNSPILYHYCQLNHWWCTTNHLQARLRRISRSPLSKGFTRPKTFS